MIRVAGIGNREAGKYRGRGFVQCESVRARAVHDVQDSADVNGCVDTQDSCAALRASRRCTAVARGVRLAGTLRKSSWCNTVANAWAKIQRNPELHCLAPERVGVIEQGAVGAHAA
eukprot:13659107-Alexandrium_andersonii.AAC.1